MNINVVAGYPSSAYRRKSFVEKDVVELGGFQTRCLAEAVGGARLIEPSDHQDRSRINVG
jgi:hypothetical protein